MGPLGGRGLVLNIFLEFQILCLSKDQFFE
jgi:hypothetical protein